MPAIVRHILTRDRELAVQLKQQLVSGKAAVMPSITMQVNGEIMMGWTPSQLDMFAKDWIVL